MVLCQGLSVKYEYVLKNGNFYSVIFRHGFLRLKTADTFPDQLFYKYLPPDL